MKKSSFREYAISRSVYEENGAINLRVKFWHDVVKYYEKYPMASLIDDKIWELLTGEKRTLNKLTEDNICISHLQK